MFGNDQGGGQIKMPTKIEPSQFGMVLCVMLAVMMTFVGDKGAFGEGEPGFWGTLFGALPAVIYMFTENRLVSSVGAGMVYLSIVGAIGAGVFIWLQRHVLEPMQLKRMIEVKRRQKEYLNKHGDDTI